MANEYKQCPNGHYYQGAQCPYCKPAGNNENGNPARTEVFGLGGGAVPTDSMLDGGTTQVMSGNGGVANTTVVDNNPMVAPRAPKPSSHTVFGDEEETENVTPGNVPNMVQGGYRETRKLVGWLVSYTLDAMGADFKLYEGRNIIGRDVDCNISVNDNMVSGRHAVILFRAGKYSITDSQSSHGTFVNDEDIELEPRYLKDGDMIRMGKTLFKFRTSF